MIRTKSIFEVFPTCGKFRPIRPHEAGEIPDPRRLFAIFAGNLRPLLIAVHDGGVIPVEQSAYERIGEVGPELN